MCVKEKEGNNLLEALVITLGFEPASSIRAIASHNLRDDASIIIITPSFKDERVERAFLELKRFRDIIFNGLKVTIQKFEVDLMNFSNAVLQIKALLSNLVDKRVALCFSGGMRGLCIAVYTACLLLKWRHPLSITVYLEGRAEYMVIPPIHKIIKINVSEEGLAILRLLSQSNSSISNLAKLLKKDRSTVYRQLLRLKDVGLVEQRGRVYKLTELGRIFA
ncbi:MAG: CRISPR-associated CARF protein Csa3 [Candidatus Methanomethyliaceae archaeon]|nr:CRISPR-associated CARF protein Csa3 [Candidatus Methanomethyliaceae archaeon]